ARPSGPAWTGPQRRETIRRSNRTTGGVVPMLLRNVLAFSTALLLGGLAAAPAQADPSVAARLDARGVRYVVDEDGDYRVTYNYADEGRTQLVFVSGRTESIAGFRIREVFAPAARIGR